MYNSKTPDAKPTKPNLEGTNARVNAGIMGKGTEVYKGHVNHPIIDGGKSTPVEIGNDWYAKQKQAEFRKSGGYK